MKLISTMVRTVFVIAFGVGLSISPGMAKEASSWIPPIIQNGFSSWAAKDASYAFDIWRKGGLMETDRKLATLSGYFNRMDQTVGKYRSFERVDSKKISETSQIIYLAINFEHAAVYARFLVFRGDKDWVIQNMDFSTRPEAIMPWLAFAGEDYSQ